MLLLSVRMGQPFERFPLYQKDWPPRQSLQPGMKMFNIYISLNQINFVTAAAHKTGTYENFVKAMDKSGQGFKYLRSKFPLLRDAKIKEGVFIGPQICELLKDSKFKSALHGEEKDAWEAFKLVAKRFLGKRREGNCEELMENFIKAYKNMGCNILLKIHFFNSHLALFPANSGAFSDEHGASFHQDISARRILYQVKWSTAMLADYSWTLTRYVSSGQLRVKQKSG